MSASKVNTFYADAVLFDMDGTLTDSIAAVEAAWGKVADDLELPRAEVIAATHGRRAVDNLAALKPHIKPEDMEAEVEAFERTILAYADAYNYRRTRPKILPVDSPLSVYASPSSVDTDESSSPPSLSLTPDSSLPPSRSSSTSEFMRVPFMRGRTYLEALTSLEAAPGVVTDGSVVLNPDLMREEPMIQVPADVGKDMLAHDVSIALEADADAVDRSIRVLPGVHRVINSIPEGRYAVATSGARTYAHGALTRVGITPPPVTITASDPRLKNGKPHPEPFLLAASELGFPATRCVVFEDSPAGIKAGVASGATVIAVATSHDKEKIMDCGAHYVVDNMDSVKVTWMNEGDSQFGRLKFCVTE
ncbi:hypothetical protein M422DRAFT_153617 [Sphaerobolus stellatus SS14]|nr:hypothetical protein M422DRAFT_153617 [Sphaerobolus stellatus SS14]